MSEGDITRRQVLGVAVAALTFGVGSALAEAPKKKLLLPAGKKPKLYRRGKKAKDLLTKLDPGIYQNPKTGIIHLVDADKKLLRVGKIDERRLKKLTGLPVLDPSRDKPKPRVHLAVASRLFEQRALALLEEKKPDKAADLLLRGARHDLFLKTKNRQAPNFRLWDLGVGISHRFGQKKQFAAFLQAAQQAGATHPGSPRLEAKKIDFKSRLRKWQDAKGHWAKSWGDPKTKIRWVTGGKKGQTQALVF